MTPTRSSGRANRLLAPRVTAIATTFPDVFATSRAWPAKATLTGNPVRPAVVAAAATPYPAASRPALRLLVFGGSQGARVMADIVPPAIGRLDAEPARAACHRAAGPRGGFAAGCARPTPSSAVAAEVAPFFSDLPARMAASHLVVSRSGASTVAELAAIGRPSILVPLPHALDQDQFANAGVLERAGGAVRIDAGRASRRSGLRRRSPGWPRRRRGSQAMAAAARSVGRLDAADRLADLVLKVAVAGGATK